MLIVKSFDMSDEKGMNAALQKHTLSKGAAVFVSDGKVVLQMDDGRPMNKEQKIIQAQEARESMALTLIPINHAQNVLLKQIIEVQSQIARYENSIKLGKEKTSKITGEEIQKMSGKLKNLKNNLAQFEMQHANNQAEIDHVGVNLQAFDEEISDLQEFSNE